MGLPMNTLHEILVTPLAAAAGGGIVPRGTRANVFEQIYWVFLILGTIVGIVVIAYMTWKAFKYRDDGSPHADDVGRPQLGEIPQSGGGGKKLFLSFSLSAIIVISLIVWTYGTLLYVENAPAQEQNALEVDVIGFQFGWDFVYENGKETTGTLRVPAGQMVHLTVTSDDVFHNFAIPELRVKSDAIPGQTTETWFTAEETKTYEAQCFELCGAGHSYMNAEVIVMEPSEFQAWYTNESA